MKKINILLFLAVIVFAGNSHAVVIDFDSYADDTILAVGTFDAIGVHFDQTLQVNDGDIGDLPQSQPNTAVNFDSFGGNITGFFLGPVPSVNFISVFAGDNGGDIDTVTLLGYDALNNLVDSDTFTGASAQTLSIFGFGITRFEIIQVGAIAIDDFTFLQNAVPEPGVVILFSLGLTGLLFSRRRMKT